MTAAAAPAALSAVDSSSSAANDCDVLLKAMLKLAECLRKACAPASESHSSTSGRSDGGSASATANGGGSESSGIAGIGSADHSAICEAAPHRALAALICCVDIAESRPARVTPEMRASAAAARGRSRRKAEPLPEPTALLALRAAFDALRALSALNLLPDIWADLAASRRFCQRVADVVAAHASDCYLVPKVPHALAAMVTAQAATSSGVTTPVVPANGRDWLTAAAACDDDNASKAAAVTVAATAPACEAAASVFRLLSRPHSILAQEDRRLHREDSSHWKCLARQLLESGEALVRALRTASVGVRAQQLALRPAASSSGASSDTKVADAAAVATEAVAVDAACPRPITGPEASVTYVAARADSERSSEAAAKVTAPPWVAHGVDLLVNSAAIVDQLRVLNPRSATRDRPADTPCTVTAAAMVCLWDALFRLDLDSSGVDGDGEARRLIAQLPARVAEDCLHALRQSMTVLQQAWRPSRTRESPTVIAAAAAR